MELGLLLLSVSAASAEDIPGLLIGRATLAPLPAEITSETRTAAFGDTIFSQQARVTEVAQLQRNVPVHIGTPTGDIRRNLREGELLYRVELNDGAPQHAFCSFDPIVVPTTPSRPRTLRFCLGDIDGDGDFDNLYYMRSILGGRREGGEWVQNQPPLVSGDAMSDAGAIETAGYAVLTNHNAEPVQLEIRVMPSFHGIGFQLMSARENGGTTQIDSRNFSRDADLPATIDVLGARIEVLSREGNSITYRVLNGFPEGQVMRVANLPAPAIIPARPAN